MSGGHFGHPTIPGFSILSDVADDDDARRDVPDLCDILRRLEEAVCDIVHELDYHYEGDSHIDNMRAFELAALRRLRAVFPADEVDLYAAVQAVIDKAHDLDRLEKLKADVAADFHRMDKVIAETWWDDVGRLRWLNSLLHTARTGEDTRNGNFMHPPSFGVQLLADWQLAMIRERIAEIKARAADPDTEPGPVVVREQEG